MCPKDGNIQAHKVSCFTVAKMKASQTKEILKNRFLVP
jgi:hypothetical protein